MRASSTSAAVSAWPACSSSARSSTSAAPSRRSSSPSSPARVEPAARGFRLSLDRPVYGVAPGQAAVLYEDDAVVGAGLIASTA